MINECRVCLALVGSCADRLSEALINLCESEHAPQYQMPHNWASELGRVEGAVVEKWANLDEGKRWIHFVEENRMES